jgi:hypothetical protein
MRWLELLDIAFASFAAATAVVASKKVPAKIGAP